MGEQAFALVVGYFSVHYPGTYDIFVVGPVYGYPSNNANTFSPGAMKLFSGFKSILVEPL